MSEELNSFKEFMKKREEVGKAYVNGDAKPLGEIVTHESPATFFSPKGDYIEGANEVFSRYENDSKGFDTGSDSKFEILQISASGGIAYWVGFQRAKVNLKGKPEPVSMDLRITEVFCRENDEWKMVHRHADMLKEE